MASVLRHLRAAVGVGRLAALAVALIALAGAATACAAALQREADSVEPPPAKADGDRGKLYDDGCMIDQREMRWPTCVYGKRKSRKTVVLFGDSQAMQWFPPLRRLARRHGWRLIGRTRAGCPPAAVNFASRCNKWRKETLRRIERHDRPDVVVTGTGVVYEVIEGGRRLGLKASRRIQRKGLARTLRRLRRTGAKVRVMKTLSWAPFDAVACVEKRMKRLRRCAFDRKQPMNAVFEARATKRVKGAKLIDARDRICLPRICPAVIDGMLVYRDPKHLSATFARSLAPWLDRRLPRPR
ncbi:MAG: SGNH hydrolase domain-containing protein [Thermoleophilaceae bacterium]